MIGFLKRFNLEKISKHKNIKKKATSMPIAIDLK